MKLDKAMLDALLAQSDSQLWASIVSLGSSKGFTLPQNPPPAAEMQRLRSVLAGNEKVNLTEAFRIINRYRKNG